VLAISLGVPVVGAAVEGMHGVLADGRGVLAAPEDSAALARAINWAGRARRRLPLAAGEH
jgi:glycosyltransferase involved in cell wall biosynthesis